MIPFDNSTLDAYKAEANAKWGKTDAYREHKEKTHHYSKDKWNDLAAEMDSIFAKFSLCARNGGAPDSAEAQCLVKQLQCHITDNYYHCTNQILAGLGQMYVADDRFRANIDRHADGTAAFVCEAIAIHCNE